MGGACSSLDALANIATAEEVRNAVRSIEAWQKAQETVKGTGAQQALIGGALLNRIGGLDVVKQVVEGFYRRLYGDPRLILFLHDKEITYLRAKQSAFMGWLFGPPNVPYTGRNVRVAHLRIIKQRGFSAEDFDLGMTYFEDAMRELGAHEKLIAEVMVKVRPFKDAIFTPSARDSEEEARWAVEERNKLHEQNSDQASKHHGDHLTLRPSFRRAQSSRRDHDHGAAAPHPDGGVAKAPSLRGPQCPFSSGRISRPSSANGATALGIGSAGVQGVSTPPAAPAPLMRSLSTPKPPSPPLALASVPAERAATQVTAKPASPSAQRVLQPSASRASASSVASPDAVLISPRPPSRAAAGSRPTSASCPFSPKPAAAVAEVTPAAATAEGLISAPQASKGQVLRAAESIRALAPRAAPVTNDAARDIVDAFLSEVVEEEAREARALAEAIEYVRRPPSRQLSAR